LKPTPASRLRRAYLHLEYSTVFKHQTRSWHKVPGRVFHPAEVQRLSRRTFSPTTF
jgi:hypothetical protein